MGGKSAQVILPLVALGAVGAATGGFGLLGAGAGAGKMGAGSLTGVAAQKAAAQAALQTAGNKTLFSSVLGGVGLGSNVLGQVGAAQSQQAALDAQIQAQEAQQLGQELQLEEQKKQTQKDLQSGLARINNSGLDSDTRSSLADALNSNASSQLASATAQNALSMQRLGAGITQSRIEKAATGNKLFKGLFDTGVGVAGNLFDN